jgi:hypothetical protein
VVKAFRHLAGVVTVAYNAVLLTHAADVNAIALLCLVRIGRTYGSRLSTRWGRCRMAISKHVGRHGPITESQPARRARSQYVQIRRGRPG